MRSPNILYLHSHDTGRYVQPYGYALDTPNIQQFAREGVLFRQAFCGAPTCSPSRAVLLTGQAAHSCGMFGLVNRGFDLRDKEKLLPRTLRQGGYQTILCGVTHVVKDTSTLGYEEILPTSGGDGRIAEAAAAYLARPPREPFFLDVGFSATHRGFPEPSPADDPNYVIPPAILPDTPRVRRDMAAFHASARRLDEGMGTVLQALERGGLGENTLVILTTDHGIAFPGMKCNLTDHGIGVMLMMRGPGAPGAGRDGDFRGGRVVDAMVSQADLFPTVCDVAGVERPPWLQGLSLLPLLGGPGAGLHEEVFAEVNYHCCYEPMRAVRTGRWKYIRRFLDRPMRMPAQCDDGPSKRELMEAGWRYAPAPAEELYDFLLDPQEVHNLATDGAHADTLQDMRDRLEDWMTRTDDPILAGPIAPPPGAVVNDPTDLHPQDVKKRP